VTRLEIAVRLLAERCELSLEDATIRMALETADRILALHRDTLPRTWSGDRVPWMWGGAE